MIAVSVEPTVQALSQLPEPAAQYLLWVDGVGGYLVCLGHRVTLGQANLDSTVDIPLQADVSRHHATVQRDPEGYFLEAVRRVQVNGQPADKVFLRSADRVTLGGSCQLQFWQPVPVSTSARLDLVSGHRFLHPVNAVVLMADTLVIGPAPQAHVVAPELPHPLIVFRNKGRLAVRWPGKLTIDGRSHEGRGPLEPGCCVVTEPLTLSLEQVGKKR